MNEAMKAVVVPGVAAQGQGLAGGGAGLLQPLGPQLAVEERVGQALVHQRVGQAAPGGDESRRIVLRPCRAVVAEIAAKGLLPPRHVDRRADRREADTLRYRPG